MAQSVLNETDDDSVETITQDVYSDLANLYKLLGLDGNPLTQELPIFLCSPHLNCVRCSTNEETYPLHQCDVPKRVRLLTASLEWKSAYDIVGYCRKCLARYYADRITYVEDDSRLQRFEYDTKYLRVSVHGVWVERRLAEMQENAINLSHMGWDTFANWANRHNRKTNKHLTVRQSKRIYLEHFSRRLLVAHGKDAAFSINSDPSSDSLAIAIRAVLGRNGGVLNYNMRHNCRDCTHHKRYLQDLVREGLVRENQSAETVAEHEDADNEAENQPDAQVESVPAALVGGLPMQPVPEEGELLGYVRMAVADGKTLGHRICAVQACKKPLVNYKNGRFCLEHLPYAGKCGITSCNTDVAEGELTCTDESHRGWYRKYIQRFKRLTFPGVNRVIRRQQDAALAAETSDHVAAASRNRPNLNVHLPDLAGTAGQKVAHTFKARKVYCIVTIQWSCGCPMAWGKCYAAESLSDVLEIIDKTWHTFREFQPEFLVYDNACNLLRHIVTQNPLSPWLVHTKLIVDAWHYISHKSTDMLCRTRCNPAPADGSQPDLVKIATDNAGRKHTVRAFNTETAEQLNSWLNGFEPHTRQMTDFMFDFFIHGLLMLYSESVHERIDDKNRNIPEKFWERRHGDEYNSEPSESEPSPDRDDEDV